MNEQIVCYPEISLRPSMKLGCSFLFTFEPNTVANLGIMKPYFLQRLQFSLLRVYDDGL